MSGVTTRDERYWAERRQHPRYDTHLSCSLRDEVEPSVTAVMMRNLSQGGCFVLCDEPLPEGSPLTLQFSLPELERVVVARGEVAWQKLGAPAAGMGVRFTDVHDDDLQLVRTYLREVAKEGELEGS